MKSGNSRHRARSKFRWSVKSPAAPRGRSCLSLNILPPNPTPSSSGNELTLTNSPRAAVRSSTLMGAPKRSINPSLRPLAQNYLLAATKEIPMTDLVLVTDASGFTGSHIVEHLLKAGYRVRGVAEPQTIVSLRTAYLDYGDSFEAIGIADLDHDNLTDVFKDVNAVILSSVPIAKGHVSKTANSIVQSGSSGTRHVLKYVRAANITKVIHTGSFANVLHPDDSWNPIVVTEDDWNPQTEEDGKKLGLHPWCLHTAARVIAERELWKFSDANPDIDVTSILPGFPFGPYGRGQVTDHHRIGTFAWISALLHGPPGRPMTPNAPPFSPNYIHVADVARAHVVALRTDSLDPPRRKRVLLVAGYMLWHEVIAHLSEAMPEIKERLPSALCGPGPQAMAYARFEMKNAREILGIEDYKSWREAIEDAVKDMLEMDSMI